MDYEKKFDVRLVKTSYSTGPGVINCLTEFKLYLLFF